MVKKYPDYYDPRPLFDIRMVPLKERFKSVREMKAATFKAALPDLAIAGLFLYSLAAFLHISPDFKSNLEGVIIVELIVLILFPVMFRIFASEGKAEFRATRKLRFMTGWINLGAGIIFGTCMLWILSVVPMIMIREEKATGSSDRSP